jgi:restriction-modification system family protein
LREKLVTYGVSPADREPLIRFMVDALKKQGCRVIHTPPPDTAPFRITFETPQGERMGIMAYAFLANNKEIKNRPNDEHRFQIKYGGDLSGLHEIWQDPYGLYVTLLLGINPEMGFFVAADPVLRNPTRFSLSVEFKDKQAKAILERKWFAWERERRPGKDEPLFEALVGGTADEFLRLIRFEREALGEEPGERHYLAEHFVGTTLVTASRELLASPPAISAEHLHALAQEFSLPEKKVLDLISERRMLKMAVRGSVAEEHLVNALRGVPGVRDCNRLEADHGPDVALTFQGTRVTVECKNSSRVRTRDGCEKIDLQRTRAAKADPCSRYYKPSEFDLVAACIHAVTEKWEFKYAPSGDLDPHRTCVGRLSNNVKLDQRWTGDASAALLRAVA